MAKMILVVAMIVSLGALFGAIGYLAKNKPVKIQQPQVSPAAEPETANQIIDETADWKTYKNEEYGFEVKYPADKISIYQEGDWIFLNHSIVFDHSNLCDFGQKGAQPTLKELTDFNVAVKIEESDLLGTVQLEEGKNISGFISDNALRISEGYIEDAKIGLLKGYRIINAFEGCGADDYYFVLNGKKTLVVRKRHIAELVLNPEKYLNLSGIITNSEANNLFNQILSTFKFTEKAESE